jgi:hypothetical protein
LNLSTQTARTNEFVVEFTNAVHVGLGRTIGKNEAESVLFHLSMVDGLLYPAEFDRRLVALLGKQATVCLEKEIVLELVERLSLPLEVLESKGDFDFNGILRAAERAALSG